MIRIVHLGKHVLLLALAAAGSGFCSATESGTAAGNHSQTGAQIVAQGTGGGAMACASCHGYDGTPNGSGAVPILSRQSAYYLAKQLRSFASGSRQSAVMTPIAKGLTDDEMLIVSQYYASTRPKTWANRPGEPELVSRGRSIATGGNAQSRLQACDSCHGPNGTGEKPAIPYLSGQFKQYIESQLQMFRRSDRKNSEMEAVSHQITDQERAAVAAYFDQLPLPLAP